MDRARIIDGKAFAAGIREKVARRVALLKARHGVTPGLAVVQVGDDAASRVYTRNKARQTVEAEMASFKFDLAAETTQENLLRRISELNEDSRVNGILVQLPLPDRIEEHAVINAIDPAKDVDGFHTINTGLLATGQDALVPCTPLGCLMMLRDALGDLEGRKALVLGRSNIVGKPMAMLLVRESCTVTVAHSRTRDLPAEVRQADVLVAAAGRPRMVKGDWIKPGAAVIDVGINRVPAGEDGKTRLVGDVDFDEAVTVAGAITPVPGGVGPMTIACLLHNTVTACCRQSGIDLPED